MCQIALTQVKIVTLGKGRLHVHCVMKLTFGCFQSKALRNYPDRPTFTTFYIRFQIGRQITYNIRLQISVILLQRKMSVIIELCACIGVIIGFINVYFQFRVLLFAEETARKQEYEKKKCDKHVQTDQTGISVVVNVSEKETNERTELGLPAEEKHNVLNKSVHNCIGQKSCSLPNLTNQDIHVSISIEDGNNNSVWSI